MINEIFKNLKKYDTPTICNALELIDPSRKNFGYTTENLISVNSEIKPIVGFAKTATVRSLSPPNKSKDKIKSERVTYYEYINDGNKPSICVMQDLDGKNAARGAFWGQFNSNVHLALGCVAAITDGAVRDLYLIPKNFQILASGIRPSHGHIHIVDFGNQVNIHSMVVNDGDLVHMDIHGAVTYPFSLTEKIIEAAEEFIESERSVIEASQKDNITFNELMNIYQGRK